MGGGHCGEGILKVQPMGLILVEICLFIFVGKKTQNTHTIHVYWPTKLGYFLDFVWGKCRGIYTWIVWGIANWNLLTLYDLVQNGTSLSWHRVDSWHKSEPIGCCCAATWRDCGNQEQAAEYIAQTSPDFVEELLPLLSHWKHHVDCSWFLTLGLYINEFADPLHCVTM